MLSALLALDAGDRPARREARLDSAGRLARAGARASSARWSSRWSCCPTFGTGSQDTQAQFSELGRRMAAIGHPLDATAGPVITDFPIWMAETQRIPTLALPDESPTDVLDLAHDPAFPGTHLVILMDKDHGRLAGGPRHGCAGRRLFPRAGPR